MRAKRFRKYFIFSKGMLLECFAYKAQIWVWSLVSFISTFLWCLLWSMVYKYSSSSTINGFDLPSMFAYVIFARIVSGFVSSESYWQITNTIFKGDIAITLSRPVSYRMQLIFSNFGGKVGGFILIDIPLLIVGTAIVVLGFNYPMPSLINFLLFFASLCFAMCLIEAFDFLFGQIAFKTAAAFGLYNIKGTIQNFLSGGIIPLVLFPVWAQGILKWLPFASLASTPINILMGRLTAEQIAVLMAIQLAWACVLFVIGLWTYRRMVKHVVSFGG